MKKLIHILLILGIHQVTFGQSLGKFSLGVGTGFNVGSYTGFGVTPNISFSRFYAKNLEVGLKVGGNYNTKSFYMMQNNLPSGSTSEKKFFNAAILGRYYISNYRLRPFVSAEIGLSSYSIMSYYNTTPTSKTGTGISEAYMSSSLGVGFSYAITKKRNLFLDGSFNTSLKNNTDGYTFTPSQNSANFNLRYIFGKQ